jgi:hypothetical protein
MATSAVQLIAFTIDIDLHISRAATEEDLFLNLN